MTARCIVDLAPHGSPVRALYMFAWTGLEPGSQMALVMGYSGPFHAHTVGWTLGLN